MLLQAVLFFQFFLWAGGGQLFLDVEIASDTFVTPVDYSLPDSSVQGISQARILEWVAISFPRGSSQLRD